MFGGKETKPNDFVSTAPVASKSSSSKEVKTLIGEGCTVEGNFFIPTATRIDGTIKGNLTGQNGVVIGVKGRIEGNITSSEAVIYGTVVGNIEAQRLELKKGSDVSGDISVIDFVTEQGCQFNGRCTMNNNIREMTGGRSEREEEVSEAASM